jgi:hypothetical protein
MLGTFWRMFAVFVVSAKSQNIVIYSVFVPLAWKKYFLQHGAKCVNTTVFARHRPKNTLDTVIFATISKKLRKDRGFFASRAQKTPVFSVLFSDNFKKK